MPAPLVWLGLGIAGLFAADELHKSHQKSKGRVAHYPGESDEFVEPVNGSLVTCGIFGVFDHTGIWVDGNIIELAGNGLIRGVSPDRFIDNRSGEKIYIACDDDAQPLVSDLAAERAVSRLFEFSDYDVITNNCHRFVWQCLSGERRKLTQFTELNRLMSEYFDQAISWKRVKY